MKRAYEQDQTTVKAMLNNIELSLPDVTLNFPKSPHRLPTSSWCPERQIRPRLPKAETDTT